MRGPGRLVLAASFFVAVQAASGCLFLYAKPCADSAECPPSSHCELSFCVGDPLEPDPAPDPAPDADPDPLPDPDAGDGGPPLDAGPSPVDGGAPDGGPLDAGAIDAGPPDTECGDLVVEMPWEGCDDGTNDGPPGSGCYRCALEIVLPTPLDEGLPFAIIGVGTEGSSSGGEEMRVSALGARAVHPFSEGLATTGPLVVEAGCSLDVEAGEWAFSDIDGLQVDPAATLHVSAGASVSAGLEGAAGAMEVGGTLELSEVGAAASLDRLLVRSVGQFRLLAEESVLSVVRFRGEGGAVLLEEGVVSLGLDPGPHQVSLLSVEDALAITTPALATLHLDQLSLAGAISLGAGVTMTVEDGVRDADASLALATGSALAANGAALDGGAALPVVLAVGSDLVLGGDAHLLLQGPSGRLTVWGGTTRLASQSGASRPRLEKLILAGGALETDSTELEIAELSTTLPGLITGQGSLLHRGLRRLRIDEGGGRLAVLSVEAPMELNATEVPLRLGSLVLAEELVVVADATLALESMPEVTNQDGILAMEVGSILLSASAEPLDVGVLVAATSWPAGFERIGTLPPSAEGTVHRLLVRSGAPTLDLGDTLVPGVFLEGGELIVEDTFFTLEGRQLQLTSALEVRAGHSTVRTDNGVGFTLLCDGLLTLTAPDSLLAIEGGLYLDAGCTLRLRVTGAGPLEHATLSAQAYGAPAFGTLDVEADLAGVTAPFVVAGFLPELAGDLAFNPINLDPGLQASLVSGEEGFDLIVEAAP